VPPVHLEELKAKRSGVGVAKSLRQIREVKSDGVHLAIDSSSQSLAFAVYQKKQGTSRLIGAGKINLPPDMADKLRVINVSLPLLFSKYPKITAVIVEQTIYIQSPQTSRILSYIVGHTLGKSLELCGDVRDVEVMKWKSFIGYKNVSKKEKEQWTNEIGPTEAKKKAAKERKERTQRIMKQKIKGINDLTDHDIIDAIAIGYWSIHNI